MRCRGLFHLQDDSDIPTQEHFPGRLQGERSFLPLENRSMNLTWASSQSLTIFAVLSIAITVLALMWSFIVMRNFDKGLKRQRERVSMKRKEKRKGRQQSNNNREATPEEVDIEMKGHRMSID